MKSEIGRGPGLNFIKLRVCQSFVISENLPTIKNSNKHARGVSHQGGDVREISHQLMQLCAGRTPPLRKSVSA